MQLESLISVKKLARLMDVNERTVRNWIKEEPIFDEAVIRRNQTLFIKRQALEEFLSAYQEK